MQVRAPGLGVASVSMCVHTCVCVCTRECVCMRTCARVRAYVCMCTGVRVRVRVPCERGLMKGEKKKGRAM